MIDVLRGLGVPCIVVCELVYVQYVTFWIACELCDPTLGISIGFAHFFVVNADFVIMTDSELCCIILSKGLRCFPKPLLKNTHHPPNLLL